MSTRTRPATRIAKTSPINGTRAVRKESGASEDTPDFSKVQLRVHAIECVKTTKEVDRDEIYLAAIKVEGELQNLSGGKRKLAAKAEKGVLLDAGKFKKGDTRRFNPPRLLATFPAGAKLDDCPRYFYATLLMIEKDEGALGDIVNQAVKSVEKGVVQAVTKAAANAATTMLSGLAAGAAVGSAIPVPLVGQAVGAAAGMAVSSVAAEIKKSRKDDVFTPESIHLELGGFPKEAGQITGSRDKATFKDFKGHYVVTYSWAIA
jgi:hypothetical protein